MKLKSIVLHVLALTACHLAMQGKANAAIVYLDTFDGGEGRFTSVPTSSGSSGGLVAASSTAVYTVAEAYEGVGSQALFFDDDPAVTSSTFAWRVRHLSGGGTVGNNAAIPVSAGTSTFVGYWLKTSTPGLQASLTIDESASVTERSVFINIQSDNQWHFYQWDLTDPLQWENFAGGDGDIDGTSVTLDSVYLIGPTHNAATDQNATIFLDAVYYNAVPEPSHTVLALLSGACLLSGRRRHSAA